MSSSSCDVGFVGCGVIASAVATGLIGSDDDDEPSVVESVAVTRRSEAVSSALRERHGDAMVTVHDDVRDVVRRSDVVFLTVLPEQVEEVLGGLADELDPERHTLVSMVSTATLDDLRRLSGLPANRVYKMICLPSAARREGTCLVAPAVAENGDGRLRAMFETLGGLVECGTEAELRTLMVATAVMGPLYGTLRRTRDWMTRRGGVDPRDATTLLLSLYGAAISDAARRDDRRPELLDELVAEQTAGGLNEQALRNLERRGVLEAYDAQLDAVLSRLEGTTDGELP